MVWVHDNTITIWVIMLHNDPYFYKGMYFPVSDLNLNFKFWKEYFIKKMIWKGINEHTIL